jgi:uncharacterized protein YegJ (DUF2314 family)
MRRFHMSFLSDIRRWLIRQPKEAPLISVVLHFQRAFPLAEDTLRTAIVRAWGRDVNKGLNESVALLGSICFVNFDGMSLHLTNAPRPYCPAEYLEQALKEFPEMRQQKVVRKHKAFLAIDLLKPKNPDRKSKEACYRRIARLAAEFVDGSCLGVYLPETGHLRPYDSDLIKALQSEQPWREIEHWGTAPVMPIEDDDPRLQAAVAEARRRWPEFVEAFERRAPEQVFSVKAPFTEGDHTEWMWVVVSSVDDEKIEGTLGNDPVNVRDLHENDRVSVHVTEVGDWVYQRGEDLVGGFSLQISAS